jgi:glycosyltransferase involved in cell wall biosynthesis
MDSQIPLVAIVGGPDVDSRLDLIQHLCEAFRFVVIGCAVEPRSRFAEAGFGYYTYSLDRRVNPLNDLITVNQLINLFKQIQPHIVHAFDTKPCVLARVAARLAGVPIVIGTLPGLGSLYVDDSLTTRMVRMIYEKLQRLACYLSDLTIFQNCEDAQQFVARGIVPIHKTAVIPGSGVRTDLFNPATIPRYEQERVRAELGIPPNTLLVTMVSRLIRSKGVAEFAAAAQIVRQQHPQTHFLLVGPADEESMDRFTPSELLQLTRALTWAGARSDIPAILAASDICVLPTFYREGIPRVLLEAASMGLPIVTTDSPGCKEVVEPGVNGFLIPPRDPGALAEAILRLVEEPDLRQRFGQESRRRAVTYFDLSVIAKQIRSIYRELLAHKGLLPATEA